jgi:type VI secretion system secreted protein VgrG
MERITFSSSSFPHTTRVVGFRGTEAISRLYRFDAFVSAPSDEVDFDLSDAVGSKARLTIDDGVHPPYYFAGVIGDVELIQEFGGFVLLRAVIVPRLAELALTNHSRMFTNKSALDVIKAVLEENGVTRYEAYVTPSRVEEHICQYRESDLVPRFYGSEG